MGVCVYHPSSACKLQYSGKGGGPLKFLSLDSLVRHIHFSEVEALQGTRATLSWDPWVSHSQGLLSCCSVVQCGCHCLAAQSHGHVS